MLILKPLDQESQDERQGKMLLMTEYGLLSLLHDQKGVIHHHGLFKVIASRHISSISGFNLIYNDRIQDQAYEEAETASGGLSVRTGKTVTRLNLVLDCLSPHEFCSHSNNYVNLQQYVIKEKKLTEQESLLIFREVAAVVSHLHAVNQPLLI